MKVKDNSTVIEELKKVENKFSKEQLLASGCFQDERDIVDALLSVNKQYTIEEVKQKIEDYKKRRVK